MAKQPDSQARVSQPQGLFTQGPGAKRQRPLEDDLNNDVERRLRDEMLSAIREEDDMKAINAMKGLEKAYNEQRLSEKTLAAYKKAQQERDAYNARLDRYKSSGDNFVQRAEAKTMGESPMERLAHLARFNEQSLAFMMFCKLLHFGFDMAVCVAGAKLMLGHEMRLFNEKYEEDKNKLERDKVTFDWDDYTCKSDDPADKNATQERLKQRKIHHFRFKEDGKFELYGPAITDINEISYDVLIANGLFPKPSRLSQVRKSCIEYCVEMSGVAGDRAYWIQKQIEEGFEPKQSGKLDDAESSALLNRPKPGTT